MDMELVLTPSASPNHQNIDHAHFQSIDNPLSSYANSSPSRRLPPPPPLAVTYRECMRNHAAATGGYVVDGCGEFMPSPTSPSIITSLICDACGCHRNFHRREPDRDDSSPSGISTPPFLDFRRPHQPSSISPSPRARRPPCFADAVMPHPRMSVTAGAAGEIPVGRKRFRTKFSDEQKEKMQGFSEKVGWRMRGCDRAEMEVLCRDIGVTKTMLKVWMHNHKKDQINGFQLSKSR